MFDVYADVEPRPGSSGGKEVSSNAFEELIEVMAVIVDSLQFIFFLPLNNLVFLFSLPFRSFQKKVKAAN